MPAVGAGFDRPDKLGPEPIKSQPWSFTEKDREVWSGKPKGFTVQPMLERFRTLRDSDRLDVRQKFDRGVTPLLRMQLAGYEQERGKHVAAGGDPPDGVAPPPKGT